MCFRLVKGLGKPLVDLGGSVYCRLIVFILFFFEGKIEERKTNLFCLNRLIYCPVIGPYSFAQNNALSKMIGDIVLALVKKIFDCFFIGTTLSSFLVLYFGGEVVFIPS